MPQPLRTKLALPPTRAGVLPRTALVDRLRTAATPGRTVLVVAGAGWGKSTLVAAWAREERRAGARVAWFSVDETDDDPVRFWSHVVAALADLGPGPGERSARLLAVPGTSTVHDVVPALLNELADLTEPVVLVVDDHHLVGSPEVHRGLALLLEHLPATVRLALVGRAAPPLRLARLRGRGRLVELGPDDLRLSPAETAALLAGETGAHDRAWTAAEAAEVHARTEGWVAGLHLAVLSRRLHPAAPDTVRAHVRADAPLADYLRTEVLDPLPAPLRTFLRRTAVLERFCVELAAAVSGQADAAALLLQVERAQLFLVPLDDHGGWYRYHHLFADVLRDDLARAEPALVGPLHTRAARWYDGHGRPVEAVQHALQGDDRAVAADLVAAHAPAVIRIGQVETARGWFRVLGDDVCTDDARLATARALAGANSGRPHDIVRWADAADRAPAAAGDPAVGRGARVQIAMARWAAAVFAGDAGAGLRHADEARQLLADLPAPPSGFVLLALGVAQYRAGRLDASWTTLAHAEGVAEYRDEPLAVVTARGLRALQAVLRGRPGEAALLAHDAEAVAERHGLAEHFNTATSRLAQGLLALHDGRPRRALDLLNHALELVRRGGLTVEVAEVLTVLAAAEDRLGRHVAAERHLAEARQVLHGCPDPGHLCADPRTVDPGPAEPAPPADGRTALSRRQAEILRLLADDLTSTEIADRLALSRRTVEAHLRVLYRKLGVRSRAAATRYAVEHGVVARPGHPTR